MKKITLIIGARPNFMKAFPVYEALKEDFALTLIHTGQHFDTKMSDVFFNQLKFPRPDIHLTLEKKTKSGDFDDKMYVNNGEYLKDKDTVIQELMTYEGDLGQLGEIRDKLKVEFEKCNPDLVIVFGDVTSTLAAGLAAKMLNIDIAHVESGLRSGDMLMPEEVNRVLTDHITKYYFVTEQSGVDNLKEIGVTENVYLVGNTMIDTQKKYLQQALDTKYYETLGVKSKEYVLITLHRPSNVDDMDKLKEIFDDFEELSKTEKLVYPIHPRTKSNLEKLGYLKKVQENPNIILDEPLGYLEFTCLMANCKYLVTDSGGLQEESTALDIPCFTLRENTERPSTLIENNGTNQMIHKISEIELKECKGSMDLWDGKSAVEIKHIIYSFYNKIYIPIGINCKTAALLKCLNIRKFSLLTDYINLDLKQYITLLNIITNYDNFKSNIYSKNDNNLLNGLRGKKYFMHYPEVDRILKLGNRLNNILKTHNITCVHLFQDTMVDTEFINSHIETYNNLKSFILKKNQLSRFKLMCITHNNSNIMTFNNVPEFYNINLENTDKNVGASHISNELIEKSKNYIMNNILHIIYTKFMIVSNEWISRGRKKEEILDINILRKKVEFIKKYYLNWVESQTYKNFVIYFIVDNDLQLEILDSLKIVFNNYENINVCFYDGNTLSFNYNLKHSNKYSIDNFVKNLIIDPKTCKYYDNNNLDYVITTRIDDDDLLENDFIKNIQLNVSPLVDTFTIYGSNKGFVLNDTQIFSTTLYNHGSQSIGLSLIQKTNTIFKLYFNVFSFSHHNYKDNIQKIILNNEKLIDTSKNIDETKLFMDDSYYWIYNRILSTSVYYFNEDNELNVGYKKKFNLTI